VGRVAIPGAQQLLVACALPILVGSAPSLLACATSPYDRYQSEHPGWVPMLPSAGIRVAELDAVLHVPPRAGHDRSLVALRVFRWDGTGWTETGVADARDARGTFGVVAKVRCRPLHEASDPLLDPPAADGETWEVERVSWYLLTDGRLSNWDHYEFVGRCLVANAYEPTSGTNAEHSLVAIASELGANHDLRGHLYLKGIELLEVGRPDEALALWRRAEVLDEPLLTHHPKWIDEHGEVAYPRAVRVFREQLHSELAALGLL
jgi:hypothetical protein